MSKILFVIVGLVVGAALFDFGGAIAGAVIGFLLASVFGRQASASEYEAALAQLRDEIRDLKTAIRGLNERMRQIESGRAPTAADFDLTIPDVGPAAASSPGAADAQPLAPIAPLPEISERELEAQALAAGIESVRRSVRSPVPEDRKAATDMASEVARAEAREVPSEMAHEAAREAAPQWAADAMAASAPRATPHRSSQPAFDTPADVDAAATAPGFNPITAARDWLFGGNSLVRVGVVVLFFGLAFLIKFAAEHTVVPLEVRYLGVAISALVALGLGWRLRHSREAYAMALQGLGVAILYLVTFAAFRLHGLLPGGLTFALLVCTCVLSAALAVLQNARALAVIGICGGFLAPVLASTGGGNHVALFSYYALLNVGIVGIAWFRAWRPLNVLGFLFTFGIGSLWGSRNYRDELFASTEPFLLLFFFFYLAIALLYARRRRDEMSSVGATTIAGERIDYVDGTLVFGTPLAAFGLQYLMVRDMPYGSAFSALGLGLIYVPLALLLYRRGRDEFRLLVESFLALGVVFASLAIPLALDAQWTSAAWAAEGAGIYWVGLRQRRPVARGFALLLQFGAGISFLRATGAPGPETIFGLRALFDGPLLSALFVGAGGLITAYLQHRQSDAIGANEASSRPLTTIWGFAFLNLIFPLLLDLQWSGLAWALSGAATVALATRHANAVILGCGVVLQVFGGIAFALATSRLRPWLDVLPPDLTPIANSLWLGGFLISAAGIVSACLVHKTPSPYAPRLATAGLAWGLVWWWFTDAREIDAHAGQFALAGQVLLATATALLLLAGGRLARWQAPVAAALLLLPMLALFAVLALARLPQPAAAGGWLAWPAALAVLPLVLRRQEDGQLAATLEYAHALALWLLAGLATWQCWWWFRELGDAGSAWPILGWVLSPLALLALLGRESLRARWPLARFPTAYRLGSLPLALGVWLWVFIANATSNGSAAPLPYLPLANPLDLATAGALLVLFSWLRRAVGEQLQVRDRVILIAFAIGGAGFYWFNGVLLRSLHHWAGVPLGFDAMMHSTLVQATLSLAWALLALALMMMATRRGLRVVWLVGGGLMAVVVAKLFLVDLSRVGTVERIVSFIGVGVLLLILGYFSPVPPAKADAK